MGFVLSIVLISLAIVVIFAVAKQGLQRVRVFLFLCPSPERRLGVQKKLEGGRDYSNGPKGYSRTDGVMVGNKSCWEQEGRMGNVQLYAICIPKQTLHV